VTAPADGSTDPFEHPALPVDDPDELAGVVDLFGALARGELVRALVELAYRQHGRTDEAAVAAAVDDAVEWAIERYYLVACDPPDAAVDATVGEAGDGDPDTDTDPEVGTVDPEAAAETETGTGSDVHADAAVFLTVGPVAFPTLPAEADDLPHILDYPSRSVSRASLARSVESRLRGDAARAVAAADAERVRHLLDVTYDLEAWAPVDVGGVRERLDDALAAVDTDADRR
jgi:hypothetical protein